MGAQQDLGGDRRLPRHCDTWAGNSYVQLIITRHLHLFSNQWKAAALTFLGHNHFQTGCSLSGCRWESRLAGTRKQSHRSRLRCLLTGSSTTRKHRLTSRANQQASRVRGISRKGRSKPVRAEQRGGSSSRSLRLHRSRPVSPGCGNTGLPRSKLSSVWVQA